MKSGQDFTIRRGATATLRFTIRDVDASTSAGATRLLNLTGSPTLRWRCYETPDSSTPVIEKDNGSTGGIFIVPPAASSGKVTVALDDTDTDLLTLDEWQYYHVLSIVAGTVEDGLAEGSVRVLAMGGEGP